MNKHSLLFLFLISFLLCVLFHHVIPPLFYTFLACFLIRQFSTFFSISPFRLQISKRERTAEYGAIESECKTNRTFVHLLVPVHSYLAHQRRNDACMYKLFGAKWNVNETKLKCNNNRAKANKEEEKLVDIGLIVTATRSRCVALQFRLLFLHIVCAAIVIAGACHWNKICRWLMLCACWQWFARQMYWIDCIMKIKSKSGASLFLWRSKKTNDDDKKNTCTVQAHAKAKVKRRKNEKTECKKVK